ncbi:MAG TPA: MBL fold metallo-hydrolase [Magnetospirillaceae bacterium]|jgi:glyoxylase-like metal-dependent hydrolase (beta-lactamase superfamily II)
MNSTFQLDDMVIHQIVERQASSTHALDYLPGLTPEILAENRSWLAPHALDTEDKLVMCFQSYIVQTPYHTVLVDSCIGNDKDRPNRQDWHMKTDDTYMQGLAAIGIALDEIDFVLCTHLHADHVGWNTRLLDGRWVPTFPNARYIFAAREYAYWLEQHGKAAVPPMVDSVLPVVAAGRADLVSASHVLNDHIRLMATPGHTPDHFAIRLGRGKDHAVMAGDLIHSPLQARYPELSMWADFDAEQAKRTRRQFLETYCDTETLCCTAHFPSPSSGHVIRWDDGFRFRSRSRS